MSGLIIKNKLLKLGLSYSDFDNDFKYNVHRALTLGSVRKFVAQIMMVHSKNL